MGGFAASIHSAMSCGLSSSVRRAQALVSSPEAIRGKTGPVPNGAVLFGPFSYANKKKDEKKEKGRGDVCVCPERSSKRR